MEKNHLNEYFIRLTNKKTGEHENIPIYGENYKDALNRFDVLNADKFGDSLNNYKVKRIEQRRCEYNNLEMLNFYKNMGCQGFVSVFYYLESFELDDTVFFLDKYGKQYSVLKKDIISM